MSIHTGIASCPSQVFVLFVAMFVLSLDYIKNIQNLNSEMNIICQAEPEYTFTQNVIREMILNSSKPILNTNSFTVSKDSIENAYNLN